MAPPRRNRRKWPGLEPGYTFADEIAGLPAAGYFRVSSNPDDAEQKSVDDQESEFWPWAERSRVKCDRHRDVFPDDDRSASIYAFKDRPAFIALREAIRAGRYKIVWFWATNRQTRGDIPIDDLMQ
ncbi:MAG TPA: recombinase family protein, partial [Streptosporangiaceae bacterium]|nr:recombinase family protein [Streptosporangiaceae bacterium]